MNTCNLFATLAAQDPEIVPFLTRFCQHTGKPISQVTQAEFAELVKIHGLEVTKSILQMTQKSYAPEWIWQNDEGLTNLALWQPKEYFIYAMSTLMFPAAFLKSYGTSVARDFDFQNRITAWQNCQQFDIEIIKPIAELCRRIIAKCNPSILRKVLAKCEQTNVAAITDNLENLTAFHLELEDLLKWLIQHIDKLEAEDKRGFSNFAAQRMIMGLSTLELEVMQEMNDFELIPEKSAAAVEVLVGQRYAKKNKQAQKLRFSCKPATIDFSQVVEHGEKPAPIKLKFNFGKGE